MSTLLALLYQNIINFDMYNSILLYPNDIRKKGALLSTYISFLEADTDRMKIMYLGQDQINWMIGDLNSLEQLAKSNKREFNRERCKVST